MTETLASVQAAGPQAPSTDPLSKTTEVDPAELGRKRFTIAVLIGVIVIAVPYVWIACDQWTGKLDPFRSVSPSNIY